MNKKALKIIEFSVVIVFASLFIGFSIPTIINNVNKARTNASYLGAKAYYEEYLLLNKLEKLEEGQVIYYNDGHLYWMIDDDGNISEDPSHNEKTPLEK